MVQDLLHLERRLSNVLARSPAVLWAVLFGSAARGEAFRDLDVGVMFRAAAAGPVPLGRLVADLESEFPSMKIDVVDVASLSPVVAGRISRERRVLVDRAPVERAAWEVDANRRALDLEPWLLEFERLRREALRRKLESEHG